MLLPVKRSKHKELRMNMASMSFNSPILSTKRSNSLRQTLSLSKRPPMMSNLFKNLYMRIPKKNLQRLSQLNRMLKRKKLKKRRLPKTNLLLKKRRKKSSKRTPCLEDLDLLKWRAMMMLNLNSQRLKKS